MQLQHCIRNPYLFDGVVWRGSDKDGLPWEALEPSDWALMSVPDLPCQLPVVEVPNGDVPGRVLRSVTGRSGHQDVSPVGPEGKGSDGSPFRLAEPNKLLVELEIVDDNGARGEAHGNGVQD